MLQKLLMLLLAVVFLVACLLVLSATRLTAPPPMTSASSPRSSSPSQPAATVVKIATLPPAQSQAAAAQPSAATQPQVVAAAPQQATVVQPAPQAQPQAPQAPPPTMPPLQSNAQTISAASQQQGAGGGQPQPPPPPHSKSGGSSGCTYYKVRSGDTLWSIAMRYGTTVAAIQWANGLSGTIIYTGQVLCIPTKGGGSGGGGGGTAGPWYGEYFNNDLVQGPPNWVRYDQAINFNWGFGTPQANVIRADGFSVRWTTVKNLPQGVYSFSLTYDDGMRILVNDVIVWDDYSNIGEKTTGFNIPILAGSTTIRVEYVERVEKARACVTFRRISSSLIPPEPPWTAEYFNNTELVPPPAVTNKTNQINFNWGMASPFPGVISIDYFTVRFAKSRYFEAGRYQFVARGTDGVRVFVDNNPVINEWRPQPFITWVSPVFDLSVGFHELRVEYINYQGPATINFYWERR